MPPWPINDDGTVGDLDAFCAALTGHLIGMQVCGADVASQHQCMAALWLACCIKDQGITPAPLPPNLVP